MDGPGEVTSFKVGIIPSFNDKQKTVPEWSSHIKYNYI